MRFERDGWLHIEPWEIWLELTEHPENEEDRTMVSEHVWNRKKAEVNDHSIKIPAAAFHIEYEQQWLGEIHFTCNRVCRREKKGSKKNDMLTGWKAFAENTGYRVADEY